MDKENKERINFNGEEFIVEDLEPKAQYIVKQLKDLSSQIELAKIRLDQLELAYRSFTELLESEIASEVEARTEEEFVAE